MKTKAAVLTKPGPLEIMELDLEEPRTGEVLVKYAASGLCHTDLHMMEGILVPRYPIVLGHEGSGTVEAVGPGVTRFKPNDHVVCSYIPSCGRCRYCATGRQNLCDLGATVARGCMPDETFRLSRGGENYGAFALVGTFAEYGVVLQESLIKIDDWLPLDIAALVSCGVPTGWGAAVYAADVRPGDTIIVYGTGGVGINAVQGAAHAGARYVIAVDPQPMKRELALAMGATHAFATAEEAQAASNELSWGQGADKAIICVDVVHSEHVTHAFDAVGKGGVVVIVGVAARDELTVQLPSASMITYQKTVRGAMFGWCNPQFDIVRLLRLYDSGALKLDELVTARYPLDDVNQGYEDLKSGQNVRGLLVY